MTKTEELRYLVDLLQSAASWRLSEGDDRSPVEIEIDSRINNILGDPCPVVNGRVQNKPKLPKDSHKGKLKATYQGRSAWVPTDWVKKVTCKSSRTGYKYVPVPEYEAEFYAKFGVKYPEEVENAGKKN